MPLAYPLPTGLPASTVNNASSLVRIVCFALISGAAIASRLFAVVNFESIIHELYVIISSKWRYTDKNLYSDPWFN